MSVLVVSAVDAALVLMMLLFGETRQQFFKRQAPRHSARGSRRGCCRQGLHSGHCHGTQRHPTFARKITLKLQAYGMCENNSILARVPPCLHPMGS